MIQKTQDPKYGIKDNRIVNMATGEPIPLDEPIFIMRAKDSNAAHGISLYADLCHDPNHLEAVYARCEEFVNFRENHPGRMREPDTAKVG